MMALANSWAYRFKRSTIGTRLLVGQRRWLAAQHGKDVVAVRVTRRVPRDQILCISVVRNEILRLPDFLRHYRALGVERFLFIDNGSADGTKEYLLDQRDVDLYATSASYSRSLCGDMWVAGLMRNLNASGWIVRADADELLVYDGCERSSLQDLIRLLENQGRRSLPCMMLDMYSAVPIHQAKLKPGDRMIDVCPMFDAGGYWIAPPAADPWVVPRSIKYEGGPRQRLFSTSYAHFKCDLAKTPFARWDSDVTLIYAHAIHPFPLNFGAPSGCLLHFKFMSDFHERAIMAVKMHGQDPDPMAAIWLTECRQYTARFEKDPELSAVFEGSRRYEGSRSLVDAGLISAINWS